MHYIFDMPMALFELAVSFWLFFKELRLSATPQLEKASLALGVGELALGFWLLVFGVNVERWKEQAALGQ